jgi:hypothetical protein
MAACTTASESAGNISARSASSQSYVSNNDGVSWANITAQLPDMLWAAVGYKGRSVLSMWDSGSSKAVYTEDGYQVLHDLKIKALADIIEEKARPKGLAVLVKATHMCMTWRGVRESAEATMTTSVLRGALRDKPEARAEFMALVNGGQ